MNHECNTDGNFSPSKPDTPSSAGTDSEGDNINHTAKQHKKRKEGKKEKGTQKQSDVARICSLADQHLRVAKSREGHYMVAQNAVPHLYHRLAPKCHTNALIANQFKAKYGRPPTGAALSQMHDMLSHEAEVSTPQEIQLRAARDGDIIWLDTGWPDGSVIRVDAKGWTLGATTPVGFIRSKVTGELPDPRDVEPDLVALAHFVNCARQDLPLVYAVLITSWFSDVPQPIFSLLGPADAGKTTAMQFLLDLVDPSTTQAGGSLAKDPRVFKALAGVRRILVLDNISYIDAGQSDLLAKVSTGGEIVTRALYTDDESHSTQLMRPVWLNGIMEGFARSDLASRVVLLTLENIDADQRLPMSDLKSQWARSRPAIFRGLLDLLVEVLAQRNQVEGTWEHRLADFQRNLRTIDTLHGTDGEARLCEQALELSEAVLDASALGAAFRAAVECSRTGECEYCDGKVGALFNTFPAEEFRHFLRDHVDLDQATKFPTTAKQLGESVRRMKPDLESILGINIEKSRNSKVRQYTLTDLEA